MILNLWSADQESLVKIHGGCPRECSENINQHCMYLALKACVFYLHLVYISNGRPILWSEG